MKDYINGKLYNTDTSIMVKYLVDEEDLGDGYVRYAQKIIMQRPREHDYYMWVIKIATDRRSKIIDKTEYICPVDEEYLKHFRKGLPDIYPE